MKYLKIERSLGYFYQKDGEYKEIDTITKDDLLFIIDNVFKDDFECDDYDPSLLKNKAHQIIYQNIWRKITELVSKKQDFEQHTKVMYKDSLEKYNTQEL